MVERIQRTRPDIQITWIIGKIEHQLVGDIPNINFIVYDKKKGREANRELRTTLADQHFDVLFLMQVAARANLVSRIIKAKMKIGFDWARSKELHWLFANKRIAAKPFQHVLDGFMGFADCAGIPDGGAPRWHIPLTESDLEFAHNQAYKLGEYVVICPSASKAERNWTVKYYQQISEYLHVKGYAVLLCGGPGAAEIELGQRIDQSGQIAANLIGKTSLKQLLAVLKDAE